MHSTRAATCCALNSTPGGQFITTASLPSSASLSPHGGIARAFQRACRPAFGKTWVCRQRRAPSSGLSPMKSGQSSQRYVGWGRKGLRPGHFPASNHKLVPLFQTARIIVSSTPHGRPAGDSGGSGPGVRKSHPHGYTLGPVDLRAMDRPPDAVHKTGRPETVFRLTTKISRGESRLGIRPFSWQRLRDARTVDESQAAHRLACCLIHPDPLGTARLPRTFP